MPVQHSTNLSRPQANAPRLKLDYEIPFFGGIDTTSDPSSSAPDGMPEEDSPNCLNVVFDSVQSVATRKGYSKLFFATDADNVLVDPIKGMHAFYQSSGSKQLVFGTGNQLEIYDGAGSMTPLTGTPATFTSNQQWSFDELLDNLYGANGTDPLIVYNGTNYSIANAAVTVQYLKFHKNRAYGANKNSSILYFSEAGDPTSWPINNFIQINTNDGQNITAIDDILDNLVIFKEESVWILTGEPLGAGNTTTIGNLQLRQANSPVGCSAFRTVCTVEQTLFFMHHSGLYALQNYSVVLISPFLKKTFAEDMNDDFINLCWGIYNSLENKYIVGYPSSGSNTPDSAIVYDLTTKQYSLWDDVPGGCAVNYRFNGLLDTVVVGDPRAGHIWLWFQNYYDVYGDNGTATSGTSTTLVDTTKSWPSFGLTSARIKIVSGTGAGGVAVITTNNATSLTVASWPNGTPDSTSVYTIGYYDSYWITKNFDFDMTGYTKRYRFFNLFVDSESYPILFGYALDFNSLDYLTPFNITTGALHWGDSGLLWGPSSGQWGSFSSQFAQANIGSTGRYIQFKFGNNISMQPWRAIKYSISYKLKKQRPNIVTTT